MQKMKTLVLSSAAAMLFSIGAPSIAYDGTNCESDGNCWEAKPGFPEKVKGSKYDPKHSKSELEKQTTAMQAMEKRNAERVENFKKTGKWSY